MWDLRPTLVSKESKNREGQEKREKKRKGKRKRREEKKREEPSKKVWILVRFGMDLWFSCMEF